MEILDKIPGIIGYAVVNAQDGSIEEVKGSSTSPLGDLSAFFSSAGEVIGNSLDLGEIDYLSLCYGGHRLVIFQYENKYLGIELEREQDPRAFMEKIKTAITPRIEVGAKPVIEEVKPKPVIELPRSIGSKLQQINLLIGEFGAEGNKNHWLDILNQGLGILAGDLLPMVGVIDEKLTFKEQPPAEKEEEFVQILRTIIDFLVKKAVEEFGSSQARVKVQTVIEKMKQG
uniref:Roadblock/LC7 domain-containing protein n=1 Tax=candidate division WOR-3 bacterium TaxID=2052148 RepID=A0A7C4XJV0_UNCW3